MIRTFRAFVWLRWRSLANALRGGQRRDRFEQISRALALFVPLILAVLSVGSVIAVTAVGFLGGRAVATGLIGAPTFLRVTQLVLLVMLAVVVGFSIWSPTQSSLSRYTRLLLLPISRQALHAIEFAAAAADPWIILLTPGLAAIAFGLAVGGRGAAAVVAALAAVMLVATLAGIASLLGLLVSWLFRSRRRSELFTLVFVIVLSLASLIPVLVSSQINTGESAEATLETRGISEDDVRRWIGWTQGLPSQLYVRAIGAGLERDPAGAGLALAMMGGQAILLFLASSRVHGRVLGAVEGERGRSKAGSRAIKPWRFPLLGPAAAAVAGAQIRTALRTVRGRLAILIPGPLLAMLAVVVQRIPSESPIVAEGIAAQSHLLLAGGMLVSLYSLQPFTMNLFGSDRSGLTMQFLQPVSNLDLARGKLAGLAVVLAATAGLCVMTAAAATRVGSPVMWAATLLGGAATYVWLGPIFVWLSALFPVPADLSKTGAAGNPHGLAMTAGTVLVPLVSVPAALILAATDWWLGQPGWALAGMIVWLALALAASEPLLRLAARTITLRRENLAIVAQGR